MIHSYSESRAADAATDHSIDTLRYLWDSRYGSAEFFSWEMDSSFSF